MIHKHTRQQPMCQFLRQSTSISSSSSSAFRDCAIWPVPIQNELLKLRKIYKFRRIPWTEDRPSAKLLPTQAYKHMEKMRTCIHVPGGIRTHEVFGWAKTVRALDRMAILSGYDLLNSVNWILRWWHINTINRSLLATTTALPIIPTR
jgi:hypothetical protein